MNNKMTAENPELSDPALRDPSDQSVAEARNLSTVPSDSLETPAFPERSASEPLAVRTSTPTAPASATAAPSTDPLDLIRQLIPTSLRKRKFRADSFVAKLTKQQLATVIAWLQEHSVPEVQAKVAAAPPVGFGMQAPTSALYRLRNMISNTELNHWIENAMDATFDILEADTSVNTAPMREALSLLLHSRVMTYVREQTDPASIDRLLSALTRLEKLKTHIAQRPNIISAPRDKTTRHKIDVHITTPSPGHSAVGGAELRVEASSASTGNLLGPPLN